MLGAESAGTPIHQPAEHVSGRQFRSSLPERKADFAVGRSARFPPQFRALAGLGLRVAR